MPDMSDSDAYRAYVNAAIALATSVEIDDRLDADPTFAADRSACANALRAKHRAEDVAKFRAATAAFLDEVTTK